MEYVILFLIIAGVIKVLYNLDNKKGKAKEEKVAEYQIKLDEGGNISRESLEKIIARGSAHASTNRRTTSSAYGAVASEVVCPHCNTKGQVRKRSKEITEESREKGIIGATIGRKTITKKGSVTQLSCDNCDVTWTV